MSKGGRERGADPKAPVVRGVGPPGSGPGLAKCCLLLLSSAPPRAAGREGQGWRRKSSTTALGASGSSLLASLIVHPSHAPLLGSHPLAINQPHPLAPPPGLKDSWLASPQQPCQLKSCCPSLKSTWI